MEERYGRRLSTAESEFRHTFPHSVSLTGPTEKEATVVAYQGDPCLVELELLDLDLAARLVVTADVLVCFISKDSFRLRSNTPCQ